MTQKELEQLFSQYGRIITSRILVDQVTGKWAVSPFLSFLDWHFKKYFTFQDDSLVSGMYERHM